MKLLHCTVHCVYMYIDTFLLGWFSAQHKTRLFVESCVDNYN